MKKILVVLCLGLVVGCGSESNSNSEEEKCTGTDILTYENGNIRENWCWRIEEGKTVYLAIKQYYQSGQIKEKTIIDCSKTHYVFEKWYEDGKMEKQNYYLTPTHHPEDGKLDNLKIRDGCSREWYENGILRYEVTYDNNRLVYVKEWDRTGKLIADRKKD